MYKTEKGTYEKGPLIGSGAFSKVYLVTKRENDRQYALAVVQEPTIFNLEKRFEMGHSILKSIYHNNLVAIKDTGFSEQGLPFSIMEYLRDVVSLGRYVRERGGYLNSESVALIGFQICQALSALHEKSVIHGDLHPGNILVDRDLRVKVIDFGLARREHNSALAKELVTLFSPYVAETTEYRAVNKSHTGKLEELAKSSGSFFVTGALGFVAPEVASRPEVADRRSDIYSLGCVLYVLLLGRTPIGLYRKPSEVKGGIPQLWDTIIERCTAYNPQDRYDSIDQVEADIRDLTEHSLKPVTDNALFEQESSVFSNPTILATSSKIRHAYGNEYALAIATIAFNLGWLITGSSAFGAICFATSWLISGLCLRWLYHLVAHSA